MKRLVTGAVCPEAIGTNNWPAWEQMRRRLGVIVLCLMGINAGICRAGPSYMVTDLGDLPGGYSWGEALGINNLGQVVGHSSTAAGWHAFIWDRTNGMRDLGELPGGPDMSQAWSINDNGVAVGFSDSASGRHAFTWDEINHMRDIGTGPGVYPVYAAQSINNAGAIAVTNQNGYGTSGNVYLVKGAVWTELGQLPGGPDFGESKAVNNHDEVVGYSDVAVGRHAFYWSNATGMADLGMLPGGVESNALDISDTGVIVGYSALSPSIHQAVLWDASHTIQPLGTLSPFEGITEAWGINESGLVVGLSQISDTDIHAVLWQSGLGMIDLNERLINNAEWDHLRRAYAINDLGQIVGYGVLNTGEMHAFLLDPAPDPSAVPLPGAVILGMLGVTSAGWMFRRQDARAE
jgi:probable HAF family extracellular repeat protein